MRAILLDRRDRSIIRAISVSEAESAAPEWPLRINSLLELPGLLGLDPGL
jgi:hypothetical protein